MPQKCQKPPLEVSFDQVIGTREQYARAEFITFAQAEAARSTWPRAGNSH
jgi:hypothetical protein